MEYNLCSFLLLHPLILLGDLRLSRTFHIADVFGFRYPGSNLGGFVVHHDDLRRRHKTLYLFSLCNWRILDLLFVCPILNCARRARNIGNLRSSNRVTRVRSYELAGLGQDCLPTPSKSGLLIEISRKTLHDLV